jgi:hypothetical protein
MKKYIGNIAKYECVSESFSETFNEKLKELVQLYESEGYHVDISFGGSDGDSICALVIARELVSQNESKPIKHKNRFKKITENV